MLLQSVRPHGHDGVSIRRLLSEGPHRHLFSADRHPSESVYHQPAVLVAVPVPCYRSFIPVRHLLSEGSCRQLLFSSDRHPYDSVFHQSVILVADPILRHHLIHVRPSPH